jgi:hypothetical protein
MITAVGIRVNLNISDVSINMVRTVMLQIQSSGSAKVMHHYNHKSCTVPLLDEIRKIKSRELYLC